jgi:hypothetical protein
MGRPRKVSAPESTNNDTQETEIKMGDTQMTQTSAVAVMDREIAAAVAEKPAIDDMPLTTLREYRLYNEAAAKENKRLRMCRHHIKPCPVELHPKQKIVFGRVDQPSNPLKVYISNSIIHFDKTLVPGQMYELPTYIVSYLAEKGTPVWKWRDGKDGSKETFLSHKEPRFALRTIYQN